MYYVIVCNHCKLIQVIESKKLLVEIKFTCKKESCKKINQFKKNTFGLNVKILARTQNGSEAAKLCQEFKKNEI
jgi:EAL domain-containing protein (putative c-di-GMP-specific phosphodiesterase class I)